MTPSASHSGGPWAAGGSDPSIRSTLPKAFPTARAGSTTVETEHLLLALTEDPVGQRLLQQLGVDPQELASYIEENLERREEEVKELELSDQARRIRELAYQEAYEIGDDARR